MMQLAFRLRFQKQLKQAPYRTARYIADSRKWHKQPFLPYLNNEDYLNVLEEHVNAQPQRKILLVWGARSVSKSEGLKIKTAEWRKRGHPVIDIDLKGVPPTYFDFRIQFSQAVKEAKLQIPRKERNVILSEMKTRLAAERAKLEASGENLPPMRHSSFLTSIGDTIGTFISTIFGYPIYNLGQLAMDLSVWIAGISAPETVDDFIALFKLLEVHAKNSSLKPPIIIWREIQNIDELRNAPDEQWPKELYRRLFLYFEPRKQGTSRVPVIFESSDLLWARAQTTVSKESFRPYLLEPFNKETARKLLVETTLKDSGFKEPIFTSAEFETLWEYSGGHQGTIYTIHNMLREGQTLTQALAENMRQDYARLIGSINQVSSSEANQERIIQERKDLLVNLHKSDYSLAIENIDRHPAALHLVKANILFTNGKALQPQYRAVELAIRDYIKTFKLVE